ncbi:dolichyl-phosphate-mannose--protein O-mannosyl transferase [Pseudomonas sp. GGS8]|uniref:hypothetical protein n=1 Tax=Pseudomonas sp. GGS8 TaxID=2817892 RepID=UPI0020A1C940|nr:hypothetical protein [Pseudomonas sp. GGS8]MCP1444836.1 dolichyl-phosphate-mannose--protein O-mannosyl transferase [Pseudomonas sp. GGS8]
MLRLFLLLIILWCVFLSAAMAFAPKRVLAYVQQSRIWMGYMKTIFSITSESLGSRAAIRWVRIQGGIGLVAGLLAQYAWLIHPVSSP